MLVLTTFRISFIQETFSEETEQIRVNDMEKKYSIKQGYVVREIAGEALAVPVDSSCGAHLVIFNPVSKFLWEQLSEEKTFDELLEAVMNNYTVSRDEASADLTDFLNQLSENGLLN